LNLEEVYSNRCANAVEKNSIMDKNRLARF
jgi:hypothetical protein